MQSGIDWVRSRERFYFWEKINDDVVAERHYITLRCLHIALCGPIIPRSAWLFPDVLDASVSVKSIVDGSS